MFEDIDPPQTWPKTVTAYAHSSKESMWDEGEKLGLKGEALSLFKHAIGEVEFKLSVNEDGTYTILEMKE